MSNEGENDSAELNLDEFISAGALDPNLVGPTLSTILLRVLRELQVLLELLGLPELQVLLELRVLLELQVLPE
ncbi:exosporium leader peptide-containing protein [Bacillus cereus group sp. Bce001]|uniref:exosporium leader peptide-containing protein n=1 Tax=Bacillus cereus group sp. Bce001 TaxID=3445260 RepID=UPI003F267FC6